MYIFLGTYTEKNEYFPSSCGKGVMGCQFDSDKGQFSSLRSLAQVPNPSWLHLANNDNQLFASSELLDQVGQIHSFDIAADHSLQHCSTQSSQGLATCHLTTSENYLYATSYIDGRLSVFPRNGIELSQASKIISYIGQGPNTTRQESAHAHQAVLAPNARWLYVCDLGSDAIHCHDCRHEPNSWEPSRIIKTPAGSGPRHLVFHPTLPTLWVVCELIPMILTYQWSAESGDLMLIHRMALSDIPTLKSVAHTAAIHLHPTGKQLGISERATHSVCVFSLSYSGELTFQQQVSSSYLTPRDFAFTPDGKWLLIAYQDSHRLTSHTIDTSLRVADMSTDELHVNSPVCIRTPTLS